MVRNPDNATDVKKPVRIKLIHFCSESHLNSCMIMLDSNMRRSQHFRCPGLRHVLRQHCCCIHVRFAHILNKNLIYIFATVVCIQIVDTIGLLSIITNLNAQTEIETKRLSYWHTNNIVT